MELSLSQHIRFVRGFRSFKTRHADTFSVCHYLHTPFTLVCRHTKIPTFVGFSSFSHVLQIFKTRYLTQISKSVVTLVAVNVVNMLRRPFTCNIKPRQPMRELFFVVYSYSPIARALFGPRCASNKIGTPSIMFPHKNSRANVVRQRAAQMFDSAWLFRCHDSMFSIKTL